jgi:uncharacterized protein YndB with AHSA1/START domain
MHGRYETIDQRPALRFERRIAHPIDAVWSAITEPGELDHWFPSAVELDLRVGGKLTFTFPEQPLSDQPVTMDGKVTDLDPPRLFAFFWGEDHLRFELEPADGGAACVLRFTAVIDAKDKAARDAAGWHVCLDGLEQLLAGVSGDTVHGATETWQHVYQDYLGRGLPSGAGIPDA